MTARQRRLIRQSYAAIATEADAIGLLFYGRLFELDPSLRSLFRNDIQLQSRKLMDTLATLLEGLDNLESLQPTLRALGQRHATYNVLPHHYDTVCTAMEWALAQALEQELQADTILAWRTLLQTVSATMKSGVEVPVP